MTGVFTRMPTTGPRVARLGCDDFHVVGLRALSPTFLTRAEATAWLEAQLVKLAAAKIGRRPCLRCSTDFESEGIHNRMCNRCRGVSDPLSATGFAGGQDGRKPRRAAGV